MNIHKRAWDQCYKTLAPGPSYKAKDRDEFTYKTFMLNFWETLTINVMEAVSFHK